MAGRFTRCGACGVLSRVPDEAEPPTEATPPAPEEAAPMAEPLPDATAPIVVDARMKPWYPKEVDPHPDTIKLVDDRWREYFPGI